MNAAALKIAVDNLDANLAATQLGITISSLALGWVGEPALAYLIEPLLQSLPGSIATASSHAIAIVISFIIITALHIVLGELAPKSLALQRSEGTALWVVRPLGLAGRSPIKIEAAATLRPQCLRASSPQRIFRSRRSPGRPPLPGEAHGSCLFRQKLTLS